jgi:hypothetical protein
MLLLLSARHFTVTPLLSHYTFLFFFLVTALLCIHYFRSASALNEHLVYPSELNCIELLWVFVTTLTCIVHFENFLASPGAALALGIRRAVTWTIQKGRSDVSIKREVRAGLATWSPGSIPSSVTDVNCSIHFYTILAFQKWMK